jgi:hypothetical protein
MSETKALEEVIDFYRSMNDTDEDPDVVAVGDQSAAELAELKADNNKLSALLAEKYEIYLQNCAEIDKLNTELDEARRIIKLVAYKYKGDIDENCLWEFGTWLDTYEEIK